MLLKKIEIEIIIPAKKTISKKNTDLQDFEKLFIQPQSLANVVKLDLYSKLQKMKKIQKNKTNKRLKKEREKHTIFNFDILLENCLTNKNTFLFQLNYIHLKLTFIKQIVELAQKE